MWVTITLFRVWLFSVAGVLLYASNINQLSVLQFCGSCLVRRSLLIQTMSRFKTLDFCYGVKPITYIIAKPPLNTIPVTTTTINPPKYINAPTTVDIGLFFILTISISSFCIGILVKSPFTFFIPKYS